MKSLSCPELAPEVVDKLAQLADAMSLAKDDWCLIGGSALVLWGVPGVRVRDIDVILSAKDARAILGSLPHTVPQVSESELFRSEIYAQVGSGIQYDFMAGFAVKSSGGWVDVPPKPAFSMDFGGNRIFLPTRQELARILKLFGRPKDLERLALLEQYITK